MKTKLLVLCVLSLVFAPILCSGNAYAYSAPVAEQSAQMVEKGQVKQNSLKSDDMYIKRRVIKKVLASNNSPLLDSVDTFMTACYIYNIDCYMLPSIAWLESSLGKKVYPSSNNAFGWGGGTMMFASWDEGVMTVAKGLKTRYISRGATTISAIGKIYAPPSTTWAGNVLQIMERFKSVEREIAQFSDLI